MKIIQYYLMALGFICAGLSAMMFYGDGFHTWCWQLITMVWIIDGFIKTKRIENLEKKK